MIPKRGRPSAYGNSPIGILFRKTEKAKKFQLKIVSNRNIDQLIDLEFNIPDIPKNAIIENIVIGQRLIDNLIAKDFKDDTGTVLDD
jgi:hypothetical protein